MELTGRQRRHLRSIGQRYKPIVTVGRGGISMSVVDQIDRALEDHELIKVRLGSECEIERREAARRIGAASGSALAGIVGNTMLLYRRRKQDPLIELPRAAPSDGAGP